MPLTLRLATFNLENLDDKPGEKPTLAERAALMRPQLVRLRADVLCLQEVNGQEQPGQPRQLLALDALLAGTPYATFHRTSTVTAAGEVFDQRNLVVLSRFPIAQSQQHKHVFAPAPSYQLVTVIPPATAPLSISWDRPILHAQLTLGPAVTLHVINLHLKSKLPTDIPGQKLNQFTWKDVSAWAEGSFVSSMKRVGQALEVRRLVDQIFNAEPAALIAVCGDLNAEADEVPVEAIRGDVENTNNPQLAGRVMVPCERSVPEQARFSLIHHGKGAMLDHVLASRALLAFYRGTEIHNELLHDESAAFATDVLHPESDHAPVVAQFELP
jgi:endonuclease/exonuclease/phosphatase family metal-dependent hydrolase